MTNSSFRVIIVGGGIGGLALAISLQHAGIDYTLVEKAKELDPQVGASIGILPNGARLLDQLGCFDDLAEQTVEMVSTASHAADGSLIGGISDTLSLMRRRTGYPVIFIDRQLLLRSLARRIKDHHRILLETTVASIDQYEDKAVVRCKDGTTLEADVVVGSDGVHSFVRHEMWRHADAIGDGRRFSQDKEAMSAEYKCLFGISTRIPGMEPGQTDRTYAKGLSTLSYVGKEGRVFWFVFIKMDRVYYPPDIPKFSQDDVAVAIRENQHIKLREDSRITIGELYKHKVVCNLVALEEAEYQHWSYGRLVCMGDSIHKMTPNLGAGASAAIESAAVLSNIINQLASTSPKPTFSTVRSAFRNYQRTRTLRVERTMQATNKLTRVQALQTTKDYIFAFYIAPQIDDQYAEAFSSLVIGAPMIEHLPVPKRSLQGTMPFNPKQGWGYEELISARMMRALPLIALAILFFRHQPDHLQHQQQSQDMGGWLYQFMANSTSSFDVSKTGGQETLRAQRRDFTLAIQSYICYGLWLLESTRLSNKSSLLHFPLLFGLAWHHWGFSVAVPLHLFLLYIHSPIQKFRALDMRLTDLSYTCTVGPLITLLGVVPIYLGYANVLNIADVLPRWVPQSELTVLFLISLLQFLFARFIRPSTVRTDRIDACDRDVGSIRWTIGLFATLTSLTWINFLFGWNQTLLQNGVASSSMSSQMYTLVGQDGVSIALSSSIWLALVYRDLHAAGMAKANMFEALVAGCMTLVCMGPATLLLLGWQWREEILLKRRHRDAVTTR